MNYGPCNIKVAFDSLDEYNKNKAMKLPIFILMKECRASFHYSEDIVSEVFARINYLHTCGKLKEHKWESEHSIIGYILECSFNKFISDNNKEIRRRGIFERSKDEISNIVQTKNELDSEDDLHERIFSRKDGFLLWKSAMNIMINDSRKMSNRRDDAISLCEKIIDFLEGERPEFESDDSLIPAMIKKSLGWDGDDRRYQNAKRKLVDAILKARQLKKRQFEEICDSKIRRVSGGEGQ